MNESADTGLVEWQRLVESIVAFEYDCSFEWRGEADGCHDSYFAQLQRMQDEAALALRQALQGAEASRERLLGQASEVCRKCEAEGGWGAERCWGAFHAAVSGARP